MSVPPPAPWRHRVVRHELVDPNSLLEHPDNWRAHPDHQQTLMTGAINELGFIGEVFASERSGRILDGHLRVALAIRDKQETIPVGWVDCESDEEELRILASYDPLASLAELDRDRLQSVVERAEIADQQLARMLEALVPPKEAPGAEIAAPDTSPIEQIPVWGVVIECENERDQVALLEQLAADGYTCRALLS